MLSSAEAAFVSAQPLGHLATADAGGRPHVVPVCFAYLDGEFWIAIDEKPKRTTRLKRLRNIEENAHVALVIDRYDDDWSRLAYVMVQGQATVTTGGAEPQALAALRQKYEPYRQMALEDRSVIRIRPERVASWGDV